MGLPASERLSMSDILSLMCVKMGWDDEKMKAAMSTYCKPMIVGALDGARAMGEGILGYIREAKDAGDLEWAKVLKDRHGNLIFLPTLLCST